LTADGAFVRKFGSHGRDAGQFDQPVHVCVTPSGDIAVANSLNMRIEMFRADGTFLRNFSDAVWGYGIAADGADHLVVSCSMRVNIFRAADGACVRRFGSEGCGVGQFSYPSGLCVTSTGRVAVCDSGNNRIQIWS